MSKTCPHCGSSEHADARFCPMSGKPIGTRSPADTHGAPPNTSTPLAGAKTVIDSNPFGAQQHDPLAAQQRDPLAARHIAAAERRPTTDAPFSLGDDIGALVVAALALYRKHLVTLALTAAVALVPVYLVHGLVSRIALVSVSAEISDLQQSGDEMRRLTERLQSGEIDMKRYTEELGKLSGGVDRALATTRTGIGSFFARLFFGLLLSVLLFGVGMPLAQGAVTLCIGRALVGRDAAPAPTWRAVVPRLPGLLYTGLLVGLAIGIGMMLLFLPGLVAAFFLCLTICVVIFEQESGPGALVRSVKLVLNSWLLALIVLAVFFVVQLVAGLIGGLLGSLIPFVGGVFHGAIAALTLPLGVCAAVLVYFAARRSHDQLSPEALQQSIERALSAD